MAHESKGLPGLRGTDHIGITAPDFDEAADFLENVLGLVPFYQMGPFGSDDSDWMKDLLNVHPRAVIRRVRHYRCGHGPNIELFEYESPDQRKVMPKNSDWGGHHISLYVDDIDAAMDHLRAHDVRLMNGGGPPVAEGPEAGLRSCYFLTPWDLQMELISYPNGKGYQQDTDDRLWDPRNPGA
ncbi:MAG: glyoxalase [Gammaproteobacteria bacterium]|nr:glyoxalase [Gammaproteobacteria bacterium]|tara:strand:- start:1065 stop:1613 length:549 start_codon:yes stop_codon:yes gene_type:complete